MKRKVGTYERKDWPSINDNGNVLTDVESIGELLNKFFVSVFSREQGDGDRYVERNEDGQADVGEGISVLIIEGMVREYFQPSWVRIKRWERMEWALLL